MDCRGGIPLSEDHWEVDEETGKTDWVPVSLAAPPLPGFPGPDRYAVFAEDEDGCSEWGYAPFFTGPGDEGDDTFEDDATAA